MNYPLMTTNYHSKFQDDLLKTLGKRGKYLQNCASNQKMTFNKSYRTLNFPQQIFHKISSTSYALIAITKKWLIFQIARIFQLFSKVNWAYLCSYEFNLNEICQGSSTNDNKSPLQISWWSVENFRINTKIFPKRSIKSKSSSI